jgi:hypothetical protein
MMPNTKQTIDQCACGSVEIDVVSKPIIGAVCYCDDCQEGARQLEALPSALPIMGADGGTELLLFRKDRMQFLKGSELVRDYRIKDSSPTRRVVATCGNTAIFLDFQKGTGSLSTGPDSAMTHHQSSCAFKLNSSPTMKLF